MLPSSKRQRVGEIRRPVRPSPRVPDGPASANPTRYCERPRTGRTRVDARRELSFILSGKRATSWFIFSSRGEPRNLLTPFRRDRKRDFANGTGPELLASKVRQALLTEGATPYSEGELPWRTNFGAALALLRHQRNNAVLGELARVYVRDALRLWAPGARLLKVEVLRDEATLMLRIRVSEQGRQAALDVHLDETR